MKIRLDIPLTVSEIVRAVGGEYRGKDGIVRFISTDSREVSADTLFIALGRGEEFVCDALVRGYAISAKSTDAIFVGDTNTALLDLASYYKDILPKLKRTVMITGSVGKTTVKDFTAKILEEKYRVHKTVGNFNNLIGLPLSILLASRNTEILVLEAGMNHAGEIEKLSLCARPDTAVITCIGSAHIGNLGTRENIAKAKLEITRGLKVGGALIVPSDEVLLRGYKNELTFGVGADAEYEIKSADGKETVFDLRLFDKVIKDGRVPLVGTHFICDLTIAALVGAHFGLDVKEINGAFSKFSDIKLRQNIVYLNNFTVYDDGYNASFESYLADFEVLKGYKKDTGAVIGDMLELGKDGERLHRELGALAVKYGISRLYPFGKYSNAVADGAIEAGFKKDAIFINSDPWNFEKTAMAIIKNTTPDSMVLIKGSRALKTEKITAYLKTVLGEKNDG